MGIKLKPTQALYGHTIECHGNNLGNLMFFGKDPWQGQTGETDKGYIIFDNLLNGARAAGIDVYGDFKRKGKRTLNRLISEFCPAGHGNNNPAAYTANVAVWLSDRPLDGSAALKVTPDSELDLSTPESLAALLLAIGRQEKGLRFDGDVILIAAKMAISYVDRKVLRHAD